MSGSIIHGALVASNRNSARFCLALKENFIRSATPRLRLVSLLVFAVTVFGAGSPWPK